MLPDINGDGYDEWGSYWYFVSRNPEDPEPDDAGFYIFMGGEEPDGEPDLALVPTPDPWYCDGPICGGDFNGDGYGDIVVKTGGSDEDHGQDSEFQFHFGNPWIADVEGEREPDLFVDLGQEYGGHWAHLQSGKLGAVGDYNGDGVDDFIWAYEVPDFLVIFAGNREWQADVPINNDVPQTFTLDLDVYPNPFNERLTVKFKISHTTWISLKIFDVHGRLVRNMSSKHLDPGEYSESTGMSNSGIYFVELAAEPGRLVKKIVCLK